MHTRLLAPFALGIFSASLLLFLVQPLLSKMLIPYLGGAPAVWTTLMLFFQTSLLLGYAYTHFSIKYLGVKQQATLHLIFLIISLVFLPLSLPENLSLDGLSPELWTLKLALITVGMPFVLLSANAPLMQVWFASYNTNKDKESAEPYFLYAVSNTGSLLALLAYPFVLQPLLDLQWQSYVWSIGYLIFIVLCIFSVMAIRKMPHENEETPQDKTTETLSISIKDKLSWVILAAVPSSLLLGSTSFMSTDISASPILWVLPLALYLLTYINTFAVKPLISEKLSLHLATFFSFGVIISIFWRAMPLAPIIVLHLGALFFLCMCCHFKLAQKTPHAKLSTTFYLYIALGGALGGLFNAFVAPHIFNTTYEYPLAFGLAIVLLAHAKGGLKAKDIIKDISLALIAVLAITSIKIHLYVDDISLFYIPSLTKDERTIYQMLFTLFFFVMSKHRPVRLGVGFTGLWLMLLVFPQLQPQHEYMKRSFFGVYAVQYTEPDFRFDMFSGNFLSRQGSQSLLPEKRLTTTFFYPLQNVAESLPQATMDKKMGVIGLGVGTFACFGPKDIDFYEIDQLVEDIARDDNFFTYLSECDSTSNVTIGDGRIELQKIPEATYGVFVLDAFSSLAIPSHLLTQEAFDLYFSKMAPNGVMLINATNKALDLKPVIAAAAKQKGLHVLAHMPAKGYHSTWLALAKNMEDFGTLPQTEAWQKMPEQKKIRTWSDGYSNILPLIKWGS